MLAVVADMAILDRVEGFQISLLWHERTHAHAGHRCVRVRVRVRERLAAIRGMTREP